MNPDPKYILELRNITKSFPGVKALDNVDFELGEKEILCLIGENGAGKSTLIKILCGAHKKDSGTITLNGDEINFQMPLEAIQAGISTIHQELNYLSDLSVAENIYLGRQPHSKHLKRINWKKMNADAEKYLKEVGLNIDPRTTMRDLSVANKQLVEIAKALSQNARIIIMDEPTSSLGIEETKNLLCLIRKLSENGISVIFISHRLDEIIEIADRVIVMRDGRRVGTLIGNDITTDNMVKLMVGREISELYARTSYITDKIMFEVKNLNTGFLKDVGFKAHSGEILGLFGMVGSGRTETVEAVFGACPKKSGQVFVDNQEIHVKNPQEAITAGIAYVSAERKRNGLILIQSVAENSVIVTLRNICKNGIINRKEQNRIAKKWVEALHIKTPTVDTAVGSLSGGNQQKVVLGKWLESKPKVLILNEPTRGVDVGAKQEIYRIMEELCSQGMCIIMIASEMAEIIGVSDRIITFCEGRTTDEFTRAEVTQEKLMRASIRRVQNAG